MRELCRIFYQVGFKLQKEISRFLSDEEERQIQIPIITLYSNAN